MSLPDELGVDFDCVDCGVHVIAFALERPPEPPLCATCLHLPGWHEDRELRQILGGDGAAGAPWPFP